MAGQFYNWRQASRDNWGRDNYTPDDKLPFTVPEVGVGALQRIALALEGIETALDRVVDLLDPEERRERKRRAEWREYYRSVWRQFEAEVCRRFRAALPPRPGERGDAACLRRVADRLAATIREGAGEKYPATGTLLRGLDALGDLATADLSSLGLSERTAERLAAMRTHARMNGRLNLLIKE